LLNLSDVESASNGAALLAFSLWQAKQRGLDIGFSFEVLS
jgi:hypothetical protein